MAAGLTSKGVARVVVVAVAGVSGGVGEKQAMGGGCFGLIAGNCCGRLVTPVPCTYTTCGSTVFECCMRAVSMPPNWIMANGQSWGWQDTSGWRVVQVNGCDYDPPNGFNCEKLECEYLPTVQNRACWNDIDTQQPNCPE